MKEIIVHFLKIILAILFFVAVSFVYQCITQQVFNDRRIEDKVYEILIRENLLQEAPVSTLENKEK